MRKLSVSSIAVFLSAILMIASFHGIASASELYCRGDVDRDGIVTAADARLVLRYSVGLDEYSLGELKIADTDRDGNVNASDARTVLRIAVGLEAAENANVSVDSEDFEIIVNPSADSGLFSWELPDMPQTDSPSGTFTFTVYGYGHGVGLSQYGALTLDEAGYGYKKILSHYYTGTRVLKTENAPETTLYPTLVYSEELGYETYKKIPQPTKELLARIVYQEIYGVTENGRYREALKALTLCIFSNLAYYDFDIESRWDVGIASPLSYGELPENLRTLVDEVYGEYIAVTNEDEPILAVYSGLAAGMTASSEDIWGGKLSYLTAVESPFDMKREGFITQRIYTVEEMRSRITSYDSSIVLSEDPSQWLEIIEHTASMDENRGYVTKIRVGNKELRGYNQFLMGLMGNELRSPCYLITYTP